VRAHGSDYVQRIEQAGFEVTVRAYQNELGEEITRRCRLDRGAADDTATQITGEDIAVSRVPAGAA
jgi:hypothetical protein